jgi:hypothetical protein
MRLSEKTLELSITSQLTHRLDLPEAIWLGLTQQQENRLGFDAAAQIDGHVVVLQFKASNVLVRPRRFTRRRRRFTLPHAQLANLQELAQTFPVSVFYALPNLGTAAELNQNRDLIAQTFYLELAALPYPFPAPTNRSQKHYLYMDPPDYELRSEPHQNSVRSFEEFASLIRSGRPNARDMVEWLKGRKFFFKGMRTYGLIIPAST